jgi:hypothetical protein
MQIGIVGREQYCGAGEGAEQEAPVVAEDVGRQVTDRNRAGDDHHQVRATEEDRIFQSYMEWLKTVYDFYKHLMVIAVASIAALAALIGGVFKRAFRPEAAIEPQLLVGLSILAFLITSVVAIEGMNRARRTILHLHEAGGTGSKDKYERLRNEHGKIGRLTREQVWRLSAWSYAVGIILFIIFLVTAIFLD